MDTVWQAFGAIGGTFSRQVGEYFRHSNVDKKDILDILVAMGIEKAYNVETVAEIIARLQSGKSQKQENRTNKSDDDFSASEPPRKRRKLSPEKPTKSTNKQSGFVSHLTQHEASILCVGDRIDYRDKSGKFVPAKVVGRKGTALTIVYKATETPLKVSVDYRTELHRLATIGSISGRIAHRFRDLEKDDFIDVNPRNEQRGWKCAMIKRFDPKSGQIEVQYAVGPESYHWWCHLDDTQEVAEFGSKISSTPKRSTNSKSSESSNSSNRSNISNRLGEQKKRIKYLEAVIQSKEQALLTLSDRYDKLQSSVDTMNEDFESGKLKRLSDDEMTALKQYPVVVGQLEEKRTMEHEMKKEKEELESTIETLTNQIGKYEDIQEAHTKLKQENETMMEMVSTLRDEIEKKQQELVTTIEALEKKTKECEDNCSRRLWESRREDANRIQDLESAIESKDYQINKLQSSSMKRIEQLESVIQSKDYKVKELRSTLETLNANMDYILDGQRQKHCQEMQELRETMGNRMANHEEMQGQLERLQGESSRLSTMDDDALKQLRSELQRSIRRVEEAEEELESQRNCVMCMENRKNVCFDGCDHMTVCQDCIGDLVPKQCPVCRAPFGTSRVLRL